MVEFFRNLFIGCCCSDNRVDKLSDMQTGPQNQYDKRGHMSMISDRGGRQIEDNMQSRGGVHNGAPAYVGAGGGAHEGEMMGSPIMDLPLGGAIVPREEIKKAAMLKIEVIEGFAVPKNTTLQINACGLVGSKRNKSDGCTIIGS